MPFLAGQLIRASDLNGLIGIVSRQATDTAAVNNSTVKVASGLVVALAASTTYAIDGWIRYTANRAADLRLGWTVPASATGDWSLVGPEFNQVPIASNEQINYCDYVSAALTGDKGVAGTDGVLVISTSIRGSITTAGTAGNLTLTYAQVTAHASNAIVKAGSTLTCTKLS